MRQPVARFESLAFQVQAASAAKARSVARHALRRAFPGREWTLTPLSARRREFEAVPRGRRPRVTVGGAWDLAYRLRAQPNVHYAEPLFEIDNAFQFPPAAARRGAGRDNDPGTETAFEWSLDALRVKHAWALFPDGRPGDRAVVAHPDTGFTPHPELDGADLLVGEGYDFEDDDRDPTDPLTEGTLRNPGHGTGTASVIVSPTGPPDGLAPPFVSGVAPFASLIPIRTTKSVVLWSMRRLMRALRHAIDRRADVVSISLGGPFGGTALLNAVRDAQAAGIIVLCAAGNEVEFVVFPAAYDEVIAVAASRIDDRPWPGSSHGAAVDITAPGSSVWCARVERRGDLYEYRVARSSGTSYAVAQTAGLAALWVSLHGAQAPRAAAAGRARTFKDLLQATCRTPAGWNAKEYGPGIAQADRLLGAALHGRSRAAARETRAPRGPLDDLVNQLAPAPHDAVARALAGVLDVDEDALPAVLDDIGMELSMRTGVDPVLRARLRRAALAGTGRRRMAAGPAIRAARRRLTETSASARLRRHARKAR